MQELALTWYATLGMLNAAISEPLIGLGQGIGIPLLSAVFFGLLGATAPCQLTTNAAALAYVARQAGDRRVVGRSALAYLLGKALVYTILGVAVILAGRQLAQNSIPVITVARRILGPAMIVLGLHLLGLLPLRFSLGQGLVSRIEERAGAGGSGAFLLGVGFAFAFCPTLFLLFFGMTIPLALRSPLGPAYPAAFAVGTTLPLLGLAALLTAGVGATKGYVARTQRIDAWIRPASAVVLILAGLNDTVTYWLL